MGEFHLNNPKMQTIKYLLKSNTSLHCHRNWSLIKPQYRTIASDGRITIDGISKEITQPKNPLFVPQKFGMLRQNSHSNRFNSTISPFQ